MSIRTLETPIGIESTPDRVFKAAVDGSGEALLALRSQPVEWIDGCIRRLTEVANLGPNWDSYGAAPVKTVAIHYAQFFLAHLASVQALERPTITATPDGNVAFAWDDHDRSMDVEIDDRGQLAYFYEKNGDEREGTTTDFMEAIELLTRV